MKSPRNGLIYFCFFTYNDLANFVKLFEEITLSFPYVLITCIDSNRGDYLHALFERFLLHTDEFFSIFVRNGVVIACTDFVRFCKDSPLFGGSDEAWFFDEVPTVVPDIPLTSEQSILQISEETRGHLSRYMKDNHCPLALGDGAGLNIVTKDDHIAHSIAIYI